MPFKKDKQYDNLVYNRGNDNFDRSIRPTPPSAKPVNIPTFYEEKLKIQSLKLIKE